MIPFHDWSKITIHGVPIYAFGVLVAVGVILAHGIVLRRAKRFGLCPPIVVDQFVLVVFLCSFLSGHVFDAVFYHPEILRADPLEIVKVHHGLSSLGGIFGAVTSGVLFARWRKLDVWAFVDACCFAFPFGWFFGRMGCALSHDHPGQRSKSFLAVDFPPEWPPEGPLGGPRYDLGLLEFLLIPGLMALVWTLDRRGARKGVLSASVAMGYATLRFPLDFLRATDLGVESDRRYASLTPAQWSCLALFALGAWALAHHLRRPKASA